MTVILRRPTPDDESAVRALHRQLATEGFDFLLARGTWAQVLNTIGAEAQGRNLPADRVPANFLLAVVNDTIVGRVSIRHELNDHLLNVGGHIGYAVAEAHRGRGYATQLLQQSVERLAQRGVERVLVCCAVENLASARVIEKCGGVLEDARTRGDETMLRYWITPDA